MVMAEPKRLQFTTLNNKPEEKTKESQPSTVRFSLSLLESTDKTCSEFSYTELLKNELVSGYNRGKTPQHYYVTEF